MAGGIALSVRDMVAGRTVAAADAALSGLEEMALFGGSGDDRLQGGFEGDSLHGRDGDDWLSGGTGWHWLYGGRGGDLLLAFESTGGGLHGGEARTRRMCASRARSTRSASPTPSRAPSRPRASR